MPPAPEPEQLSTWDLLRDAIAHERRWQQGIVRRIGTRAASATAHPLGSARTTAELAASAGRVLAPATESLSPVMQGRSLSVHFDVLTAPLEETKDAARRAGGR